MAETEPVDTLTAEQAALAQSENAAAPARISAVATALDRTRAIAEGLGDLSQSLRASIEGRTSGGTASSPWWQGCAAWMYMPGPDGTASGRLDITFTGCTLSDGRSLDGTLAVWLDTGARTLGFELGDLTVDAHGVTGTVALSTDAGGAILLSATLEFDDAATGTTLSLENASIASSSAGDTIMNGNGSIVIAGTSYAVRMDNLGLSGGCAGLPARGNLEVEADWGDAGITRMIDLDGDGGLPPASLLVYRVSIRASFSYDAATGTAIDTNGSEIEYDKRGAHKTFSFGEVITQACPSS